MTGAPLFTVFIPTIGRMTYFPDCLESARAQTTAGIDILVGDDGSTDGTKEYVESIMKIDPRIRYYRSETRLGMPENWNRGLAMIRTNWMTILSDDDLLKPSFVQRCVSAFQADPVLRVVATLHEVITSVGEIDGTAMASRQASIRGYLSGKRWCDPNRLPPMMSCCFNVGWAQEILFSEEAGTAADCDFFRRAGITGYYCYLIEQTLVSYRIHSQSMTGSGTINQASGSLRSVLRVESLHPSLQQSSAWQQTRSAVAYGLIRTIIVSGRTDDATEAYEKYHHLLSFRSRIRLAAKIRLFALRDKIERAYAPAAR